MDSGIFCCVCVLHLQNGKGTSLATTDAKNLPSWLEFEFFVVQ